MRKISLFINSYILCLLVFSVQAQKTAKVLEVDSIPFFNGIHLQGDAASAISSAISTKGNYSYEAGIQVDLKHKYFPVLEVGYAKINETSSSNISYQTQGLFERLGIEFNLISPKKDSKRTTNLFLVGVRVGMSNFNYNINNAIIADNYWGGSETVNYSDILVTKLWYEISAGVRVEIIKNIFMGWSVCSKSLINQDATGNPTPASIPGFGNTSGSNWGFKYTIGYKIDIHSKILNKKK